MNPSMLVSRTGEPVHRLYGKDITDHANPLFALYIDHKLVYEGYDYEKMSALFAPLEKDMKVHVERFTSYWHGIGWVDPIQNECARWERIEKQNRGIK